MTKHKKVLEQLISAHYDILVHTTSGSVYDQDAFKEWALATAKLHAALTIKVVLNDESTKTTR